MTIHQVLFLVLAAITLGGALGVVTSRSVFVSALWLILSFVGVAGMYVLLEAGFLAVIQLVIYVGAISVLILFAIMLTRQVMGGDRLSNSQWFLAAIVALAVFGVLGMIAHGTDWPVQAGQVLPADGGTVPTGEEASAAIAAAQGAIAEGSPDAPEVRVPGPIVMLGRTLMTNHLLAFEVASVLLLVALIGAVIIARE